MGRRTVEGITSTVSAPSRERSLDFREPPLSILSLLHMIMTSFNPRIQPQYQGIGVPEDSISSILQLGYQLGDG